MSLFGACYIVFDLTPRFLLNYRLPSVGWSFLLWYYFWPFLIRQTCGLVCFSNCLRCLYSSCRHLDLPYHYVDQRYWFLLNEISSYFGIKLVKYLKYILWLCNACVILLLFKVSCSTANLNYLHSILYILYIYISWMRYFIIITLLVSAPWSREGFLIKVY